MNTFKIWSLAIVEMITKKRAKLREKTESKQSEIERIRKQNKEREAQERSSLLYYEFRQMVRKGFTEKQAMCIITAREVERVKREKEIENEWKWESYRQGA